jgi:hypothetical protein
VSNPANGAERPIFAASHRMMKKIIGVIWLSFDAEILRL